MYPMALSNTSTAGRARVDAELVLDGRARGGIALAERAVRVDEELRHHEQRDSLHALGRGGRAGEHEVHDVLRQVMLAVGDEDLLSRDEEMIAVRLGARAHQREVGAGLRLGQIHRAGPLAARHLRQERLLQMIRAAQLERVQRALRQHRAERETHVRAAPHLFDRRGDQPRQPLPAPLRGDRQRSPAGLHVLAVRVWKALRRRDRPVAPLGAFLITRIIQWIKDFRGELRGFVEDRIDGLRGGFLAPGKLCDRIQPRQLVQQEPHVLQRRDVGTHFFSSSITSGTSLNRSPTRP
jgi:hypothetical protein